MSNFTTFFPPNISSHSDPSRHCLSNNVHQRKMVRSYVKVVLIFSVIDKYALLYALFIIIIKFPYNAHSDWLKQRALSENRERVDDGKLAFKLTNLTQIKHPL